MTHSRALSARKYVLVAILTTLLSAAATLAVADAHTWNGSHWATSPVEYYDITTNYSGNVVSRRWDFNSALSNVQTADGGSGSEVQIADNAYGQTGWDGLCSAGGTLWSGSMYIDLNDTYMLGYGGDKRSGVISHEMGHCMGGLAHHDSAGRLMQTCSCDYYDVDGVWGIDSGTAAEIDTLWN